MKSTSLAIALIVGLFTPVLAQQPTMTQKAGEAASQMIGKMATPTHAAPAAQPVKATALININKATPSELDALPSIGDARAKAIVAGRPYKSVDELLNRKILPKDSYETVKDKVSVR